METLVALCAFVFGGGKVCLWSRGVAPPSWNAKRARWSREQGPPGGRNPGQVMWVEPGEYRGGLPPEGGPTRKWIQGSVRRSRVAHGTVSLEGRAGRVRGAQAMDVFSVSQET